MIAWVNANARKLHGYQGQFVACNEQGVLVHDVQLGKVIDEAEQKHVPYVLYLVPKYPVPLRVGSLRIRAFGSNKWEPNYPVTIQREGKQIELLMMVDSGADATTVSKVAGEYLGFTFASDELADTGYGLGGEVEYALRNVTMIVDGYTFQAPVMWLQTNDMSEMLLGRQVVFDKFNIEFRQVDKQIVFTWRGDK